VAIKGSVEARCPRGCEPTAVEAWSFVRGDKDEALRDALMAGELNLLVCPDCSELFYPEAAVVYYDPTAEFVAFVFPESWEAERDQWRDKMRADFAQMRSVLGRDMPIEVEPVIYFGMEGLREALREEEDLGDQARIAAALCARLGLAAVPVARDFARGKRLPWLLPCEAAAGFSAPAALRAVEELLKENPRLSGYFAWREILSQGESVPIGGKSS